MEYNTNFISICRKVLYGKTASEISQALPKLFEKGECKFDYCFLLGLCDYYNSEFKVAYPEKYYKYVGIRHWKLTYPEYLDTKKMPGNDISEILNKSNKFFLKYGIVFEWNGNFFDNKVE